MWFKMPKGCERISVEQQQYEGEIADEGGRFFFRAPDHFAARILNIPGFEIAKDLPEGAPADLPKADPLRDGAIAELSMRMEGLRDEVRNTTSDLIAANARIAVMEREKGENAIALQTAQAALARLEETLEDAGVVIENNTVVQFPQKLQAKAK